MEKATLLAGVATFAALACGVPAHAATPVVNALDDARPRKTDSVTLYILDRVTVTSTRAGQTTPIAHSELGKNELTTKNSGLDMPFLLQSLPSVVATSDGGAGIGYTGLRIRGTDATRINVTLDGVPLSDAESHGLFWVNVPDIAASLGSVQVQRGVGTSTNGAAAFGGSVNMTLDRPVQTPYGVFSVSGGSYGTHKESISAGTGSLHGRWTLDMRLSNIHTDGFVRRATVDNHSWMARLGWHNARTMLMLTALGGKERTGMAWGGITAEDMAAFGRRWNTLGQMPDGHFYKDQTDNYLQNHLHLRMFHQLGEHWGLSATAHYTKGDGYYEEYKGDADLANYSLGDGVGNLVRRKMMDNWFGGGVFSLDFKSERVEASLGGAANRYDGDHYGRVMWIENYAAPLSPEFRYYNGRGVKDDANIYAKASWRAFDKVFFYGDLQYRVLNHRITGTTDLFVAGKRFMPDLDRTFNFFNPKGGVFWRLSSHVSAYASVAVAHREPARNNYIDNVLFDGAGKPMQPRAERLIDWEAGMTWHDDVFNAGLNLYYMSYKDQLVLTGATNEIGEPLSDNIPRSYRAGVELTAGLRIASWLRWDGTATLSRNRIRSFTDPFSGEFLNSAPIAFSPSLLAAGTFAFERGRWSGALQTNYVGRQFVTNNGEKSLSLSDYCVSSLRVGFTFGRARLGVEVSNLFDARYNSNGYIWPYNDGSTLVAGPIYYFPQAGTNVLANLTVHF